jgi:hypothetical protein
MRIANIEYRMMNREIFYGNIINVLERKEVISDVEFRF